MLAATLAAGALTLAGLLSGAGQAAAAAVQRPGAAAVELALPARLQPSPGAALVTLGWGSGSGQVGRSDPAQGLARGPEALAVAADGRVAVLDSVNRRVVVLSPTGEWLTALATGLSEPRFLALGEQQLAVLDPDVDRLVKVYGPDGNLQAEMALPDLPSPATGVFFSAGQVWVETGHEQSVCLSEPAAEAAKAVRAGRPVGAAGKAGWARAAVTQGADPEIFLSPTPAGTTDNAVSADKTATAARATAARATSDRALRLRQDGRIDHLVSLDVDRTGATIVGSRLVAGGILVSRLSEQYAGQAAPSLLLAEPTGLYLGVPYTVAPDGRVFEARADANGYTILVHDELGNAGRTDRGAAQ